MAKLNAALYLDIRAKKNRFNISELGNYKTVVLCQCHISVAKSLQFAIITGKEKESEAVMAQRHKRVIVSGTLVGLISTRKKIIVIY